ncbi:MAG: DUF5615 family PIN-like protein [Candidatus Hodarchaeota archaeon]
MTFFFDNNLSESLVKGMKAFGEDVVHLKDLFPEDTDDVIWLKHVGKNGMVLITRDKKVRWNPAERGALQKYKVGAFFLGGKNLNRCRLIQQVVRNWPRIKEFAQKHPPAYAFRIPPTGTKFRTIEL